MAQIRLSRRQALTALSAGAVACRSKNTDSTTKVAGSIDTIVVVMMENRSFDHVLGSLKLLEGRTDIDGLDEMMSNLAQDGTEFPITEATTTCVPDPPHGWNSSHDQFNTGLNDGFVREYQDSEPEAWPGEVMSYQTRNTMPITYALADAYAVPNRWFCSVMGPTWPNRFYGHAGTSAGHQSNELDDSGFYTFPTVWSKLDELGVPWGYYYSDLPFIGLIEGHFRDETCHILEQFFLDAEAGTLPPVCWVDPGFTVNDDHPPHPVGRGQEFLASIFKALAASPQWEHCLLILTYDEHGGFFDHVPPPLTDDDYIEDGFDQMGFRIPVLVIGPYVRPGGSDVVFDNTSWLKFVCEKYGIEPWTRRIAAANSIGVLLDEDRLAKNEPAAPITLPEFVFDEANLGEECSGQDVLGPTPPPSEEEERLQLVDELGWFVEKYYPKADRRKETKQLLELIRTKAGLAI
jgi:phospholipase C